MVKSVRFSLCVRPVKVTLRDQTYVEPSEIGSISPMERRRSFRRLSRRLITSGAFLPVTVLLASCTHYNVSFDCQKLDGACPYSFLLPLDVTKVSIEAWSGGGGGGGGGAPGDYNNSKVGSTGGGGGGGGSFGDYVYQSSVVPNVSALAIQVGGAGSGGVAGGAGSGSAPYNNPAKSGNSGWASFVYVNTQALAYAHDGCGGGGGGPSTSNGPGGYGCNGGGNGGSGGSNGGGGGGGGRGLSDSHGANGATIITNGTGGTGGAGAHSDAPWAWGPAIQACVGNNTGYDGGGSGGNGGNDGSNGIDGHDATCGGGGGGGGGNGSASANSGGVRGGYGGHGSTGHVTVSFDSIFSKWPLLAGSQTFQSPGDSSFTVPSGFNFLTLRSWGSGGGGGGGHKSNCCGNSNGNGGGGGGSGDYGGVKFLYIKPAGSNVTLPEIAANSVLTIHIGGGGSGGAGQYYTDNPSNSAASGLPGNATWVSFGGSNITYVSGGNPGTGGNGGSGGSPVAGGNCSNAGASNSGIGGANGASACIGGGSGGVGASDPGCGGSGTGAAGAAPSSSATLGGGGGGGSGGRTCGGTGGRHSGGAGGNGAPGGVIISWQ